MPSPLPLTILVVASALAALGCQGDFDGARITPPRGTLGRELFAIVCDRVGAQALREDITGASFHAVCHADADGAFADEVDGALLPPLDGAARNIDGDLVSLEQQRENRAHRIARIEALARRRADLIAAFDDAFANASLETKDLDSPDPIRSCDVRDETDLSVELADVLGRLTDLYDDDTIPNVTRGLARVMTSIESSPPAQQALARFDGRRGYRPASIAMGVARPALSYPRFVDLADALLKVLASDGGRAHAPLVALNTAIHEELRSAKESPWPGALTITPGTSDPNLAVLSRPRGNLEALREILLHVDPSFAASTEKRWIVRRDRRGFATLAMPDGSVPAPFVDRTGPNGKPDGLPDVDDLGRFITDGGSAPAPFADVFGDAPKVARASDGRVDAFEYLDVAPTFLSALARDLVPLLDPDPQKSHETLMNLFGGLAVVAGARDDQASRTYGDTKLAYRGYRHDDSPLLDLVHAVGQVLADPQTNDTLSLLDRLARDKPEVIARAIGVALRAKAIADAHPEATLPAQSTLWDELLDVLALITETPALLEDIVRAFADDATVDLARSIGSYMMLRDFVSYDRGNLNGPTFDLTTSKVGEPEIPVDRSAPDTGDNRSIFQRLLQGFHDANGLSVCTKPGAIGHIKWHSLSIDFPSTAAKAACVVLGADAPADPMPMCGLFRIKDMAAELVNAAAGSVKLDVRDACMREIMNSPLTGVVGGSDAFLEEVSGIKGFTTNPTIPGLSRVVFFDLPYPGNAGDTTNQKSAHFLQDLFDPIPTVVCPPLPFTDKDGTTLNLRQCADSTDWIRRRDQDATFPLEHFGFLTSAKPIARAFQAHDANTLFVRIFDVLHRHWGTPRQSKIECDPSLPNTDARWCTQDGAVSYEPLIAEIMKTDLFQVLHDTVAELAKMHVNHCDARDRDGHCTSTSSWDGVKVLAETVNDLVDPHRNSGLVRRNGDRAVVRNDGTRNEQVTPIYLLADALSGFDRHLSAQPDRLSAWRRGRSQLVDQFFSVDEAGPQSKLTNDAVTKMLPVVIATLRSQLDAHCPNPADGCRWAQKDIVAKVEDTVTGPTFAGMIDVLDAVRADGPARTELERLLVYLLQDAGGTTLPAIADLLQVFEDDESLTALLRSLADGAEPEVVTSDGRVTSRGLVLASVEALSRVLGKVRDRDGQRLCSREIDPNGATAAVLARLVKLRDGHRASPIDVIFDVIGDVNRVHPEATTKFEAADYGSVAHEVADFCLNPSRGLEQVYTVLKIATARR